MMGASQLTSKSKRRQKDKGEGAANTQPLDPPVLPNRRIVANLELEIANFRDLVTRGIVPKGK